MDEDFEERSQPQDLDDFLKYCHDLTRTLQIVTDKTLTTKGDTTKPAGRLFPQRIVPWSGFPLQQESVWDELSISSGFTSQRVFPSPDQLDYVRKYHYPINSESDLRQFARDIVERPVQKLIQEMYKNEQLRKKLKVGGTLMFESHTKIETSTKLLMEEEMEHMSEPGPQNSKTTGQRVKGAIMKDKWIARGVNRGIIESADQFCIYEMVDGHRIPLVMIEYKAPQKFPLGQIITGLRGEIRPAEDVINIEGNSLRLFAKRLLAAVITQLFSSMIGKGVQWGYIFTGEATVFLYIPDDPTTVQYHLSIPSLDFQDDDENRLHRTSVAQITAFVLNAFAAEAPSQSWHDAARSLDTWAVDYIDVLNTIPEITRKDPRHSLYKPDGWKEFSRPPFPTRARRLAHACNDVIENQVHSSGDDGDDNNEPPFPTPRRTSQVVEKQSIASPRQPGATRGSGKSNENNQDGMEAISRVRIEDRPYCTHQCLLGLASHGALDEHCPNIEDHQGQHLQLETFLCLIRVQLATDRGWDADCKPLYVKGSRGALLKIRLSSHGYTLVAKAMKQPDRQHLLHEAKIYAKLHTLQGSCIPVCLGTLDLEHPFYYDYGAYVSMLFLSWAGRPLQDYLNRKNKERLLTEVSNTLAALHNLCVLHTDAEPRNWLWDEQRIILVDFERAEIRARPPLSAPGPNKKRNLQGEIKGAVDDQEFANEIWSARRWLSQYIV